MYCTGRRNDSRRNNRRNDSRRNNNRRDDSRRGGGGGGNRGQQQKKAPTNVNKQVSHVRVCHIHVFATVTSTHLTVLLQQR